MKGTKVKEDIILHEFQGNNLSFAYDLKLADGTEARVENNGSLAVYGVEGALLGNVSTSSEADAQLLQKARQNAKKTQLLFTIPAPVVLEGIKEPSKQAKARFTLEGKVLTLHAEGLAGAQYPLSIDPSVYIETARKLMYGNNEGNVDFDTDNELIQKSQTTGARIDEWSDTINAPSAVWNNGVTAAGGFIYSVGGMQDTVVSTVFSSTGATTFAVPAGVIAITVEVWGAGGGGGGGGGISKGGTGGGGGYASATLTTTPAESLNIYVGSGGGGGTGRASSGDGGGGGGHSEVNRGGTNLVVAPGGGGGGGGDNDAGAAPGGAGAAGGNTVGSSGGSSGDALGGGGGTASAGGAGGTGGANPGSAGGSEAAGDGADGRNAAGVDGSANNGGQADDGDGGTGNVSANYAGGGGGGGGLFGGGGGSGSVNADAGGGGGGSGSCFTSGTSPWCVAGTGTIPGNDTDSDRSTAATGGAAGLVAATGAAGASGRIVITYVTGSAASPTVSWSQFDTTTGALTSPNPGNGLCTNWCTDAVYNLPANRAGFSLVAYNGYLYVFGGTTDGTAANGQATMYIAKIGANGEPQKWHPFDTNQGNWLYWYPSSVVLPAARSYTAVAVNDNQFYLVGGRDTSGNSLSTVHTATINPNGTIGTWSTTGMQDLTTPGARFGHTVHIYNGVLYVVGGNTSGTLLSSVYYSKLNSTGTMNPWVLTSGFSGARATFGGSFTTIWGGYMYIGGGCTALTSSNCSTVASDIQLASINADGSLSEWNTILNLETKRIGYTFLGWQGGLYRLGGCANQNTTSGACYAPTADVEYGVINPDGEASTVASSSASGTAPCSGGSPSNCNLPSASVGNMLNASVIVNGYLYIMGGCTDNPCTTFSSGITYQSVGSDGSLQRPAACSGTYTDSYCVSSVALPSARAAAGVAVFNGRIYLVGGFPTIANISYVSVNNNGSLGAWANTDFTTIAVDGIDDDLSYTFAYARANPASAGSVPGNLFIFGGCTGDTSGIGCSSYSDSVYKCNLSTAGVPSNCTISGQVQIGTVTGATGSGLGAHAGAVYANYIYLMGGLGPNATDLKDVRYAKFDDANNVVTVGSGWVELAEEIVVGRRRGAGFGYNGYLYVTGGYDGSDALADIEFARIDVSDGTIDPWQVSSVNINKRWGLTVPVSNSYAYVIGGCIAGPAPGGCTSRTNTIQTFQIYNNDSGAVRSFTSMSDDTFANDVDRWGASAAILNSYIYVAGGCKAAVDCSGAIGSDNATNDVQYAPISATDGSVGAWLGATNDLPLDRAWGQLEVAGGYLYYLGGQDDTATNVQSTVYSVGTFSSGNITATWSSANAGIGDTASQAAQPRTKFGATVWDNRIYVVGGLNGSSAVTKTVFYSPKLASGGNIAADSWTAATTTTNEPDIARFGGAVTAYANNLYQFGGNDGTNYLNDGQYASIGYKTGTISQNNTTTVTGTGTTFTSSMIGSKLQYSDDGSTATITAVGSATSLTVDIARTVTAGSSYIILDGSVGAWTFTTSTPGAVSQGEAFAANGYMYIVGGRSGGTSCAPNTLIAPISANTTRATKSLPTGVGEWYETSTRYAGGRYGAAVAYSQGKTYVMGGGCTSPQAGTYNTGTIGQATTTVTGTGTNWTDNYIGGTITYADASTATIISVNSATQLTVSVSKTVTAPSNYTITVPRHVYGVLKSQPQFANYSRLIDTDTDVFPTKWLMNGLDGSIGSRWQFRYRSAVNQTWWNDTWTARRKITLNNSASSTDLDNFVVRVSLSTALGNIDYAKTQNAGQDLRFIDSDGTTTLSYDIETWDEAGVSEVWVKVPRLSASSSAGYINMYYGNAAAPAGEDEPGTWTNYGIVQHMEENVTCAGLLDETSNNNDSICGTGTARAAGKMGFGHVGTSAGSQYFAIPDSASISNTTTQTFSIWADQTAAQTDATFAAQFAYNGASSAGVWALQTHPTDNTRLRLFIVNKANDPGDSGADTNAGVWSATGATFHQVTFVYDGTQTGDANRLKLYIDGVQVTLNFFCVATCPSPIVQSSLFASTDSLNVGRFEGLGRHGNMTYDELRMTSVARSADWVKQQYLTENNGMNTFGAEQSTTTALVWGQQTNYGTVNLGVTAPYIPLDASGVNTNYARYYFLALSIDGSQTFGYPEDVNRGPTITDISLFFTADPSKRLRHGKTFTGGLQQPLDTPCQATNPNCQ
jgi:hypothetical protein